MLIALIIPKSMDDQDANEIRKHTIFIFLTRILKESIYKRILQRSQKIIMHRIKECLNVCT
jgi:ribosomal protein S17